MSLGVNRSSGGGPGSAGRVRGRLRRDICGAFARVCGGIKYFVVCL